MSEPTEPTGSSRPVPPPPAAGQQPPAAGSGSPAPSPDRAEPRPAERDSTSPDHPQAGFNSRGKVRTTRAAAWWTALVVAAVLSILILVFIVQNIEDVQVKFLGLEGSVPLAVALLAAAVAGALVVAVPGIFRMAQLRRALTKNAKG